MTADQIIARYHGRYEQLRLGMADRAGRLWDEFGGLSDEDADRFVAAIVPMVAGAQGAIGGLVSAYLSTLTTFLARQPARPVPIRAAELSTEALRGVSALEVYRRPIVTARGAIAAGKSPVEAWQAGRDRAGAIAETDVVLAQREATLRVVQADERIVGYRRVLSGRSCAFCATASTQRYRRSQLMPIHARCDCAVAPIIGDRDPGQVINRQLLRNLKAAAKETGTRDYWASRHVTVEEDGTVSLPEVAVHQHGELGPVLGHAAHDFTGPAGLAA